MQVWHHLKPYFTGQEIPPRRRVTTCQKCVRTGDIENVGKDSPSSYISLRCSETSHSVITSSVKLCAWSWEFLTKDIRDGARISLYPSIYGEDDEAYDIWTKEIGVPGEIELHAFYRDGNGECDNFWEHGAGPCGPCSVRFIMTEERNMAVENLIVR